MAVIALFLPALAVLMLFGLDALEDLLFPRQVEQSGTDPEDA